MREAQGVLTPAERTLTEPRPALWFLRISPKSLQEGLEARVVLCGEACWGPARGRVWARVGRFFCLYILSVWCELLWA